MSKFEMIGRQDPVEEVVELPPIVDGECCDTCHDLFSDVCYNCDPKFGLNATST